MHFSHCTISGFCHCMYLDLPNLNSFGGLFDTNFNNLIVSVKLMQFLVPEHQIVLDLLFLFNGCRRNS